MPTNSSPPSAMPTSPVVPLLVLGGGSNVVAPDDGWPGRRRRRPYPRDRAHGRRSSRSRPASPWDDLVAHTVDERARRRGGAVRDPGLHGRHPGPERRGVRAGGRPDDHRRPRVRPRGEVRAHADPAGVRLRLPRQPAQARPRPLRRPRRHVRAAPGGALPPGRLRRARAEARRRARRDRAAGGASARRSSSCGGARAWCSTRPTPTAAAPAPSSPTRSSRRRRPSTAARPGRPATGSVKLSAAWLVQSAGFGRGTREGNVGTSSRHSLALTTEHGATAAELLAFAGRIVAAVRDQFGVTLVPEPTAVQP